MVCDSRMVRFGTLNIEVGFHINFFIIFFLLFLISNMNQLFYKDKQEKKNLPIKIIFKNNSKRSESTKKKRNKKKNINNILKTKQRRKHLFLLKITFRSRSRKLFKPGYKKNGILKIKKK